jgi:PAT family beta-lactamase induction signal transducer AmpG
VSGRPRSPLFWVLPLYVAQGLPYGVVQSMAPVYLTASGASLAAIGMASLLGLPWNLKALWSPLVDLLGRRRTWVTTSMALLAVGIAGVAALAAGPGGAVTIAGVGTVPVAALWVAAAMALVALVSATADVAQDAFYMDALDARAQAACVGWRVAAYRVALLVAGGGLVFLAGKRGWPLAFAVAAAAMAVLALWGRFALPRPLPPPARTGGAGVFAAAFGRAFLSYVDRPRWAVLLAFVVSYRLGEQLLSRMTTPFLMHGCGLTTAQMGLLSGTLGVGASIVGAIAGSALIARRGLWASLIGITIAMNGTDLFYVALAAADRPALPWIAAVHLAENFSGGLGAAAFSVLLLRTCAAEYRAAHYAIATGLMSVGGTLAGSLSGWIAQGIGYPAYFVLCTAASVPGIALLFALPRGLTGRGGVVDKTGHSPGRLP